MASVETLLIGVSFCEPDSIDTTYLADVHPAFSSEEDAGLVCLLRSADIPGLFAILWRGGREG